MKKLITLFFCFLMCFGLNGQKRKTLQYQLNYPFGAAVNPKLIAENPTYLATMKTEFNSFTAENHMKMSLLWESDSVFRFDKVQAIVDQAKKQGARIHGHTLIWYMSIPKWLKEKQLSPQQWDKLIEYYVKTVVGYYKGTITSWDVVNEAFEENGEMRKSFFYEKLGPNYMEKVFNWAHEADPNCILFYNEYNHESSPKKLEAVLKMVQDFKQKNIPLHGLGLQMHTKIADKPEEIENAILACAKTGLQIHVSELDICVNKQKLPDFELNQNHLFEQQKRFEAVFKAMNQVPKAQQYGVTTWNIGDLDSWLRVKNPKEFPTLFNDQYQRKTMYHAITKKLKKHQLK